MFKKKPKTPSEETQAQPYDVTEEAAAKEEAKSKERKTETVTTPPRGPFGFPQGTVTGGLGGDK